MCRSLQPYIGVMISAQLIAALCSTCDQRTPYIYTYIHSLNILHTGAVLLLISPLLYLMSVTVVFVLTG